MIYALYNPHAGNNQGYLRAQKLKDFYQGEEIDFRDISKIDGYSTLFGEMKSGDKLVICGGDGTLNRFVNDIDENELPEEVYCYPVGSGNDFARDVAPGKEEPFLVSRYMRNLPTVTVNGKTYKFLNGVGYGIDGYCCEVGDSMRGKTDKPINYTSIAIKGLLFYYKTTSAKITVDGKTKKYSKVWLAPTMFGRYYGGGMLPTPGQTRDDKEKISVMVMYGKGKIKTLMVFPSIFKGEHVAHKDMVEVISGREIEVEFDRPTALQIDGETILGVTSYKARI